MRRALTLLLLLVPGTLLAQSSEFGINGLGLPGRHLSARSLATGGSFGEFDPVSAVNPASVSEHLHFNASFTITQNYRSSDSPSASATGRDTRFPLVSVGGPIPKTPFAVGASFANYTDRDFELTASDTVTLRGLPVPIYDSLTSTGGLSDLGVAVSWRKAGWVLGVGGHAITGSARVSLSRTFGDTVYQPVNQRAELSYAGAGFSFGVLRGLGRRAAVAAYVRLDGHANVDRDSSRTSVIDLPVQFGGALRWRPSARLDLATSVSTRRWSTADAGIRDIGGTGARNTVDAAFGGEWLTHPREASSRPLRFGAHFRTMPFPVTAGSQPREFGVSLGSGLVLARESSTRLPRALIDLSLEHVWRSADGGYRERAWLITTGISVRP